MLCDLSAFHFGRGLMARPVVVDDDTYSSSMGYTQDELVKCMDRSRPADLIPAVN